MNSIVFFTGVVDTDEKFIDFCMCDVHTYDETTHGRIRTSVFPQALMYDERAPIWRTGVYTTYDV